MEHKYITLYNCGIAGTCFSLLPLLGILILRWLLRKNRDACHVPPKTSFEFYQTFVCVIRPTAKCCCSGNLHKRTSLWLFLQILLCYNFRWHNISESWISDFVNYLWYILLQPAVADVIVDFSHLNLLPTYQSTLEFGWIFKVKQCEAYQTIIIFNHKESDTPPQGPENSCIFDVFFGRPKLQKAMWTSSTCIGLECLWQYHGWLKSLGEGDFLCHFWS